MKENKQKIILANKEMVQFILDCHKVGLSCEQISKKVKLKFNFDASRITINRALWKIKSTTKNKEIELTISDKMKELLEPEVAQQLLQWEIEGITKPKMPELLKKEFNISVSHPTVYKFFEIINTQAVAKEKPEEKSAYDILYENRQEVVQMKKERYANFVIAEHFGVKVDDVEDFFNKRKVITKEQHMDILKRGRLGDSAKQIAEIYGLAEYSVQLILDKAGVLTTSSRVLAKAKEDFEAEKVEEVSQFSPAIIKEFTKFINTLQYKYDFAQEQIKKFDNTRNDIYHLLELEEQNELEQLELLSKIKKSSIERREYKDFVALVQPLIDFIQDDKNKKMLATLTNIAGRICNNMDKLENRVYFLREE